MKEFAYFLLAIAMCFMLAVSVYAGNPHTSLKTGDFDSFSYGLDEELLESYQIDKQGEALIDGGPVTVDDPFFEQEEKPGEFQSFSYEPEEELLGRSQISVDYSLSEPVVTVDRYGVTYRTTLTLNDIAAFYGYQIQVSAISEDSTIIENKTGGVVTPVVYKDGKQNLACITGEGLTGDIEVCDIIVKYSHSDLNQNRAIVIDKLDIISSIMAEEVVYFGGNPPAFILGLPYVEPPFYVTLWFYVLISLVTALSGAGIYVMLRKKAASQVLVVN